MSDSNENNDNLIEYTKNNPTGSFPPIFTKNNIPKDSNPRKIRQYVASIYDIIDKKNPTPFINLD